MILIFIGIHIDREEQAVQSQYEGKNCIKDRKRHGRMSSDLTDGHGQTEQRRTQSKSVDPADALFKIDIAEDAALSRQEESEGQQTQQEQHPFRHSGDLRIVAEQFHTADQRPGEREQEGLGFAVGDIFLKIANCQPQENQSA